MVQQSRLCHFMVDQYTARGMSLKKGLGTKQSGMSDASYVSDVYAAIRTAKADPRIDPERIVTFVMSWGVVCRCI